MSGKDTFMENIFRGRYVCERYIQGKICSEEDVCERYIHGKIYSEEDMSVKDAFTGRYIQRKICL